MNTQIICMMICYIVVSGHFQQRHSHIDLVNEAKHVNKNAVQVLIIGAGIAGLEAGRLLQKQGIQTMILEARNRSGGRVWSYRSQSGHMLDIGATWIHGIDGSIPDGILTNPLWDLTQEAKLSTRKTQVYDILQIYPGNDTNFDVNQWFHQYIAYVREETLMNSINLSLGYYADRFITQMKFTKKEENIFYNHLHHVIECNEGAELNDIGAKIFLDFTSTYYGDEHIFHKDGFMSLTNYLSKDISNIQFNEIVSKITYHNQTVEVRTKAGHIYYADYVLLTVPLGILKQKQIEFNPVLPQWKLDAIDRIGFNIFEKVFLLWDQAWWNASNFYFTRFSSNPSRMGYWVNANKWNDKPALICFFAGKTTPQLLSIQNRNALIEELQHTLQEMFPGTTVPRPVEVHVTNWYEDPFSYGSYSYISAKQKYDDPIALTEPLKDRLLFAGEATTLGTYGYAHGALLSARREVTRLLYDYDLLSTKNHTNSQSTMIISVQLLIIFSMISLRFCLY
ncbi:hypothetical protein I4U23_011780 [Adineta vaga]|nr:hypothetical protein I4U23_011780 [Adineta vaga]